MDPISHLVFGRTLVALDQHRRLGPGASAAAMVGALAPDVDSVLMPFGWDIYLRAHEVGTHSVVGSLPGACLTALIVRRFTRGSQYWGLLGAAYAGTLSHLVLDILSGAQVRPGWPVLIGRVSVPLVAMADPFLVGLFCVAALALWLAGSHRQRSTALLALCAIFAFLGAKGALLAASLPSATATSDTNRVIEARWASLTEWNVFDRSPTALTQTRIGAGRAPRLLMSLPLDGESRLVRASRSVDTVHNFLLVHDLGFPTQIQDLQGGTTVRWSDIRFCSPLDSAGDAEDLVELWASSPDGPKRIGCALWFGATFDGEGRATTQFVNVLKWEQQRALKPSP